MSIRSNMELEAELGPSLQAISRSVSRKIEDIKNTNVFRTLEEKVETMYSSVMTLAANSNNTGLDIFGDESLDKSEEIIRISTLSISDEDI